ncbi:MAG: hypothetical protein GXO26_02875 [Crenarchaeota archaeon]|nr:hypothetical protein [Thermoproteota archaeon]
MSTTTDKHVLYLILEAISRGATTDRKLFSKLSGLSREIIEKTLNEAIKEGLVEVEEKGHIIRRRMFKMTDKGKRVLEELRNEILTQVRKSLEETKKLINEGRKEEAKQKVREIEHVAPALAALGILQEMIEDALLFTFLTDALGIPIIIMPGMVDVEDFDDLDNVEDIF